MKTSSHLRKVFVSGLAMFVMAVAMSNVIAGPGKYHRGGPQTSVGFRAGWSGGPNGLTVHTQLDEVNAFEFIAGVNNKEMRRSVYYGPLGKCDSFLGVSYQPSFMAGDEDLMVGFYLDMGLRARIHNYRLESGSTGLAVTPDAIGGAGFRLDAGHVQLFADLHVKYYNKANNTYAPGMESGLGFRIKL